VREDRRPAAADNPLLALEKTVSSLITSGLENYGALRDAWTEWLFLTTYGSPALQAALGLEPAAAETGRRIERELVREADEAQVKAKLEDGFERGAPIDACIRALIYVRLPEAADERGFNLARRLRAAQPEEGRRSAADLKQAVKDQFLLVTYDAERAIQALPQLLPPEPEKRQALWEAVQEVVAAPGPLSAESRRRLNYVETLFGVKGAKPSKEEAQHG
jgi:hypothetical protein